MKLESVKNRVLSIGKLLSVSSIIGTISTYVSAVLVYIGDHSGTGIDLWWLSLDNIVFVSSDESVASIKFDSLALKSFVYYNIEAFSEGSATVHVETSDGLIKSEKILVTVTENTTTFSSDTTENQEKDGI